MIAEVQDNAHVISPSEAAEAASAHSRINLPLNLENWKTLDEDTQSKLLWFHQYALDNRLDWSECCEALGYDRSTVFRVLKGTYEGSWRNITKAIDNYRRLIEDRSQIKQNDFAENGVWKIINSGLNYAMANNSITLIVGESRSGKSVAAKTWKERNNHGRSVYVTAPAYGGTKMLLRSIAQAVGISPNQPIPQMISAIYRAFNRSRILLIDEAHRLLPGDRRTNPVNLEIVRDIHDQTGCALALIATERFKSELTSSEYMFEQLIGRIGMPVRIPKKLRESEVMPIVTQYMGKPSAALKAEMMRIANEPGRLGILVEILKVASRIAAKEKKPLTENYIFAAIKLRKQMMGELPE
ncbi:MAG: AAA family ATPase [Verrucomicrobiota bacterium]